MQIIFINCLLFNEIGVNFQIKKEVFGNIFLIIWLNTDEYIHVNIFLLVSI